MQTEIVLEDSPHCGGDAKFVKPVKPGSDESFQNRRKRTGR